MLPYLAQELKGMIMRHLPLQYVQQEILHFLSGLSFPKRKFEEDLVRVIHRGEQVEC